MLNHFPSQLRMFPAGFSLKFERPVKLNLSLTKLEQSQQLIEALFPQKPAKRSKVATRDESSRSSDVESPGLNGKTKLANIIYLFLFYLFFN